MRNSECFITYVDDDSSLEVLSSVEREVDCHEHHRTFVMYLLQQSLALVLRVIWDRRFYERACHDPFPWKIAGERRVGDVCSLRASFDRQLL